jgi:hypothetical protein
MAKPTKNPWGPKPIKDMTQKEFEAKHRESAHAAALAEAKKRGK